MLLRSRPQRLPRPTTIDPSRLTRLPGLPPPARSLPRPPLRPGLPMGHPSQRPRQARRTSTCPLPTPPSAISVSTRRTRSMSPAVEHVRRRTSTGHATGSSLPGRDGAHISSTNSTRKARASSVPGSFHACENVPGEAKCVNNQVQPGWHPLQSVSSPHVLPRGCQIPDEFQDKAKNLSTSARTSRTRFG